MVMVVVDDGVFMETELEGFRWHGVRGESGEGAFDARGMGRFRRHLK